MENFEPPRETFGDHAHALTRAALGTIPMLGQAAIELFSLAIEPPIHRRIAAWMNSVAEELSKLDEQQKVILRELKDNDAFLDTFLHAAQAAARTGNQEKRAALRNAVVNSALPNSPDETLSQLFIGFVDSFTPLHLRLLSFLDNPKEWYEKCQKPTPRSPDTLWPLIANAFPDLNSEEVLCERVCIQLHEHGLLIASSLRKKVSRFPYFLNRSREEQPGYRFADELPADGQIMISDAETSLREWTTELGRHFLEFISAPDPA